MRSATIGDVAQRAGVPVATVSRLLDAMAPVADDAPQRTRDAIRQLRAQLHVALSASPRRTGAPGVVLPDLHGAFSSELLLGRADAERPPPRATRRELLLARLVTRAPATPPSPRVSARPGASRSTRSQIPETAP